MLKKFLVTFFILFFLLAGFAFWGYQQLQQFKAQTIQTQPDQLFTLARGTSSAKLAESLEQQHLLQDAKWLPYLLKLEPQLNKVKAGTYSLNEVKTVQDLLQLLNSGKEAQFSIRFIEGNTFKTWRKILETAPHLEQSLKNKTEQEIFALLNLPTYPHQNETEINTSLEGWLYPDTYNYSPNSSDLDLLKRATSKMQQALDKAWQQREKDLPLENPYQMLILASIVEKETGIASERKKVASVFINRLKLKMKLQTDPTVIYGMGDNYQGNIRKKDLETATPYNTYVIDGLPPTPIAMPSESALQAVAQPEKTDFLYFVADGTGGHQFSRNYNEHQRAVQQYLRWYRQQKNNSQ